MKKLKKIFLIIFIFVLIFIFVIFLRKPSLDRNWTLDQKLLPTVSFSGNIVDIKNIRNFKYNTEDDYKVSYYDKKYDLDKLQSLYYIIEPFSKYDGVAHTMLSFGFSDGNYLVVSIEIRKEIGESFSPFLGLINSYELVYMLGDEKDLIKLRANYRKDDVFLYPIKAEILDIKDLFISVLKRTDYLSKNPEFYNTLTNNCTTNILSHVNEIRNNDISWSIEALFPSHSDKIIYDLGLIDTNLTLEDARKYYKINDLSEKYIDRDDYSKIIRKTIK